MTKAIIGKKLGMTQVFAADGSFVHVTVIEAGPCTVTQIKTVQRDGYEAVQLVFNEVPKRKLNKPEQGHLAKAGVEKILKVLKEFRFDDCAAYQVGQVVTCDVFANGDTVDVSGLTRGRGFTGVIYRWNHHRLKETHGVGPVHREVGSMSANSTPSRVYKGKKMAGQYGHEQVTIQNLEIVKVDTARNVLLVKGGVPGPKGGLVVIKSAIKG